MATDTVIVLVIFVAGVACSLTLLGWLTHIVRRDKRDRDK
jgi:putative effector of murein hydrolase LrgA (UPF0299 family)